MRRCLLTGLALTLAAVGTCAWAEDYMTPIAPPGDPAARMKTLNEIEPRTAITSLPFTVTQSGSYYLIRSLSATTTANGITIAASDVKLDLNGFALNGSPQAMDGINVPTLIENVVIRNGVLRNWGRFGLAATNAMDMVVADLKAFGCGWGGLYVGDNALLERCAAYGNGQTAPGQNPPVNGGIRVGSYSTIKECKVRNNKGAGIYACQHSRVTSCTATESMQANGIIVEDYGTIRDCTASRNWADGMAINSKCRVEANTCGENGLSDTGYGAGIKIMGWNNYVAGNICMGNDVGIMVQGGGGNLVIQNGANGNRTNDYWLGTSSFYGNVLDSGQIGTNFSNSNPWANFKF